MPGISVSIGGDLTGLHAALKELTGTLRQLAAQMQATFAPGRAAADQMSKSTVGLGRAAQGTSQKFGAIVLKAGAAGQAISGVVEGARALRSVYRYLAAAKIFQGLSGAGGLMAGLRGSIGGIGASLRSLASNPAFRRIVIGAAGAAVAIGGTVLALRAAGAGFRLLRATATGVFRSIVSAASSAMRSIRNAFSGLGSLLPGGGSGGLAGMLGPVAGLAGVAGVVALLGSELKKTLQSAAEFEVARTRIEGFTGSVESAAAMMKELGKFAEDTLFSDRAAQESAVKLLGSGIRGDVPGLIKMLGDVATDDQALTELADALGKGYSRGKFQTEEVYKFTEKGINLMPQLAAVTGKSGDALRKAIEEGLKFDQVTEAIGRLSKKGGEYYGMAARLGMTTTALVNQLIGKWESVRREFGQPILDSLRPLLADGIDLVGSLKEKAAAAGRAVADALIRIYALVKSGKTIELVKTGLTVAYTGSLAVLMRGFRTAVAFLATALPTIFDAAVATLRDPTMWKGIATLVQGLFISQAGELRRMFNDMNPLASDKQKRDAAQISQLGSLAQAEGLEMMGNAGGGVNIAGVIEKAFVDGSKAAAAVGFGAKEQKNFTDSLDAMRKIVNSVSGDVDKMRAAAAVPPPTEAPKPAAPGADSEEEKKKKQPQGLQLQTELGRIGGGGFGMIVAPFIAPMVTQQQRTNELLTQLVNQKGGKKGGFR